MHRLVQEKRNADRSKRKRVELEESLRQQKEIAAQMRRADANTDDQVTKAASDRPRLNVDERGNSQALELHIAQAGGGERRTNVSEAGTCPPERSKVFQMLEERAAAGVSPVTSTVPVRKKSKV